MERERERVRERERERGTSVSSDNGSIHELESCAYPSAWRFSFTSPDTIKRETWAFVGAEVFVQQTMKTASSDEELAFKQCLALRALQMQRPATNMFGCSFHRELILIVLQ